MNAGNSNKRTAVTVAVITKMTTALFMAATPLIFALILLQGGLGTVAIHNRGGEAIGHINNVLAAIVFCLLWLAVNAWIFSVARKGAAKLRSERDAA